MCAHFAPCCYLRLPAPTTVRARRFPLADAFLAACDNGRLSTWARVWDIDEHRAKHHGVDARIDSEVFS